MSILEINGRWIQRGVSKNRFLYKYMDPKKHYHMDSLKKKEIFLSAKKTLNDKSEFFTQEITIKNVSQYLSSFFGIDWFVILNNPIYRSILNETYYYFCSVKKIQESYGIYSMTSDPRSDSMWAHYGNNHKGFCLIISCQPTWDGIVKVKYSNSSPSITDMPCGIHPLLHTDGFLYQGLITKRLSWAYEKEYRLINTTIGTGGKSMPIANISTTPNPMRICGVILGCDMDRDDEEMVISYMDEYDLIFKCHPPSGKYGRLKVYKKDKSKKIYRRWYMY